MRGTTFRASSSDAAEAALGGVYIWREELTFRGGETAWLISQRIKNRDEVYRFADTLPRAAAESEQLAGKAKL